MKLVFLPGMDGTGKLFSPLLQELPEDDFILIAESFSGPIGYELSKRKAMYSLLHSAEVIDLPVAYIQASSDKLLSADKAQEFRECFSSIIFKKLDGPHFILQSRPLESAQAIVELIEHLEETNHLDV